MKLFEINRTTLKLIAIITMTIDHIGLILFPNLYFLRYIGRIAMPLFSYMIAEGAYYSKNRVNYLLNILTIGLICLMCLLVSSKIIYINILLTFSLSLILIYEYDYVILCLKTKNIYKKILSIFLFLVTFIFSLFISNYSYFIPNMVNVKVDYKIFGVILPFMLYIGYKYKWYKIIVFSILIIIESLYYQFYLNLSSQFFSLISILFIILYNGKKGKLNIKYFFYLYYPIHILILYLISSLFNLD